MPQILKIDVRHLGGGINVGLPRTHIADNQCVNIENFRPYGTKLVRRGGVERLTSAPHSTPVNSLFAYKTAAGAWTLLVGTESGIGKLSGTGIVQLPIADGRVYDPSDYPWVFYQYADIAYASRPGGGALKRVTSDFVMDAGIPAPATAPTLALGASGAIPSADFKGVFTYLDLITLNESNYSPVSATYTHTGPAKINWSGITVSITPEVSARRIYRTLPSQSGSYFFVAQISNNVDTTFVGDNVLVQDLGLLASVRNGLPPTNPQYGDLWRDRLFLTDGVDIFFSEYQKVECFGAESILSVFPDDGHFIRGMRAYGDRFVVGKTNKVHFLTGTDQSNFAVSTLSDRHGCWSYYSMLVAEGKLYWFGGDNFYVSDGSSVEAIGGGTEMRTFIDRIPDAYKDMIVGCAFPEDTLIHWTVPLDAYATNRAVLVYNYKTGAWSTYTHSQFGGNAPSFLGDFWDENAEHILYATFYDNHVYRYDSGLQDDGVNFTAKVLTKAWGLDLNGQRKGVERFSLQATTCSETIKIQVWGEAGLIHERTVSLDQANAFKRYNLKSISHGLANEIQIGIEYSGERHIEIEALAIEAATFVRMGMPA